MILRTSSIDNTLRTLSASLDALSVLINAQQQLWRNAQGIAMEI